MKELIERARRKAVDLGRLLDSRMDTLVRPPRGLAPLEVRNAILDEIERRLVPGPKGTYLFPYDEVRVELLGASSDETAALEATLESDGGLEAAARARLAGHGCARAAFTVEIASAVAGSDVTTTEVENRYRVHFRRLPPRPAPEPSSTPATLRVTVGAGGSAVTCELTRGRVDIGRLAHVRDTAGCLVRHNGLVIGEELDPQGTVSRCHAHLIAATDVAGQPAFRVHDDGSRYGTRIVRNGQTIPVHAGALGVKLRDGDELHFGEAVGRVTLTGGDRYI
jgi:hypothetical protein